ncbi:hypothetical protein [Clostridium felsineum]|uniref:hypothetical protein n=1 Tax=Clostridium felsineum TaxID=36839 RepID=UPI00098BE257|nr:hypothetical protein [Clostridium felsineum]URZ16912.1 hypothetical protein CLFE_029590 [Clostridium felsineum DSM 794]
MGLINAKGNEINFEGKVDLKKVFIRLKENQAIKVRVLGLTDYVEYKAHSDFGNKVYTQPCIEPLDKECPLCVASKSGVEGFDGLYVKKRYLFALGDLETGEIRVWDCSKSQAKSLIAQIKDYADDIGETAFNFKRTGNKTETSYTLNPILKLKGEDKEKFSKFDGVEVSDSFFESVLQPRPEQIMLEVLDDAGFPMQDYFPTYRRSEPTPAQGGQATDGGDDLIIM